MNKVMSLADAAARVPDGARIAFGGGGALMRRPMAFVRELALRGTRDLDVVQFLATLETDLLLGAGAVRSTSCTYLGLLEHGPAPNLARIVSENQVNLIEYSEYMFIAGLRAADMGLPFIPWKTPWRSDVAKSLGLREISDPYTGTVLLAVPAMELDVAVIHTERADADGFIQAPAEPDLIWDYDYLIARVAKTTIVCVEEVGPISDPAKVAVMGAEVDHVVELPGGAWPTGIHPRYGPDVEHVHRVYVPAAAKGPAAFRAYLEEYASHEGRTADLQTRPARQCGE